MALSAKPYKRGMPMIPKVRRRMRQIKEYIDGHLEKPITVEKIADKFGMSYAAVRGQFRERYGESMGAYIRNRRLELAAAELQEGKRIREFAVTKRLSTSAKSPSHKPPDNPSAARQWPCFLKHASAARTHFAASGGFDR